MQREKENQTVITHGTEDSEGPGPVAFCLNCEAQLTGDYCSNCGQKSDVKPYTLRVLLDSLWQAFRKFDSEVRNTFTGLLFRPGQFCDEYLAGKRKPFQDPIKYFFVSFVFQITVFGFVRYFAHNPAIDEAATVGTSMQLLFLLITFFWAISYTIVFRKYGRNLAEIAVCMLYLNAETRIFGVIIQLIFVPFATILTDANVYHSVISLIVSILYFIVFSQQFFGESWKKAILKNLLVLIIFTAIFIPFFFLYLIVAVEVKQIVP